MSRIAKALSLRRTEGEKFSYLLVLVVLIAGGLVVGGSAVEALFLSRYGIRLLPAAFLVSAAFTIALQFAYSLVVDRMRNDVLFRWLLGLAMALVLCLRLALDVGYWSVAIIFCLFYSALALFTNHFWIYAADFFDIMQSKRLYPLLGAGLSIGGLGGGLATAFLSKPFGSQNLLFLWIAAMAAAALWIRFKSHPLHPTGPVHISEKDEGSYRNIRSLAGYLRHSALARLMILSTLVMVSTLFISQYLYSEIFVTRWPDPDDLARFFGVFQICSNSVEIAISFLVTPRLISLLGVGSSNLILPATSFLGFMGLFFSYSIPCALLARFNKDSLEPSISSSVRSMFFNVFPRRLQGKMRALIEGMIYYSAIVMAGGSLMVIGAGNTSTIIYLGMSFAVIYLAVSFLMRREYRRAVTSGLREGILELGDNSVDFASIPQQSLEEIAVELVKDESESMLQALRRCLAILDRKRLRRLMPRLLAEGGALSRTVALEHVEAPWGDELRPALEPLLQVKHRELRRAVLKALAGVDGGAILVGVLEGDDRELQREGAARILAAGPAAQAARAAAVLEETLSSKEEVALCHAIELVGSLPGGRFIEPVLKLAEHDGGAVKRAAISSLVSMHAGSQGYAPEVRARSEKIFIDALHDRDPLLRDSSLLALKSGAFPGALPAMASLLDDPSPSVRNHAIDLLALQGDGIIETLREHIGGSSGMKVKSILLLLGRLGTDSAREALLGFIESRLQWACSAVSAIPQVEDETAAAAGSEEPGIFLEVLKDFVVRAQDAIFLALEQAEEGSVIRAIRLGLQSASSDTRARALETLSNVGSLKLMSLLVLLLEDASWAEKANAARRMPGCDLNDREALLRRCIASPDPMLNRGSALYCRWKHPGERAPVGAQTSEEDHSEVSDMKNLLLLKKIPLFANLDLEHLEAINRLLQKAEYYRSEIVFRENEPGDEMFIILSGSVKIVKNFGAHEIALATLKESDYFGEMALLSEDPRSATAYVAEDAELVSLRGANLRELILQRPEISFQIIRVLIDRLRKREHDLLTSLGPAQGGGT